MRNVAVHRYTRNPGDMLAADALLLETVLAQARRHPSRLAFLFRAAKGHALFLAAAAPSSPALLRSLRLAADACAASFRLAGRPEERAVVVRLEDEEVVLDGFNAPGPHASDWMDGFLSACAARDTHAMPWLCAVRNDEMIHAGVEFDPGVFDYIDGLRLLRGDPAAAKAAFARALTTNALGEIHIADRQYVADLFLPMIELGLRLVEGEPRAFNDTLEHALLRHRAYWSHHEERREDPTGFFALGPTAMACLATDRGIALDVESPYMPSLLVTPGASTTHR